MRVRVLVVIAAACAMGCGSPDAWVVDDELSACAPMQGWFDVQSVELSGTCGPVADAPVAVTPTPPEGCTGALRATQGNCRIRGTIECGGVTATLACINNRDGTEATCTSQTTTSWCTSVYRLEYRRRATAPLSVNPGHTWCRGLG